MARASHELDEAPVGVGDGEFLQQPRQALIARRVALPTGGIGQGARQVGLADPGGAGDQHRLVAPDPVTGEQAPKHGAVQAAGVTVVDVLGHRGLLEPGAAQPAAGLALVARGDLAVDQEAEAFLEGQGLGLRQVGLLGERLGHAEEAQLDQPVMGRMIEHGRSSQW